MAQYPDMRELSAFTTEIRRLGRRVAHFMTEETRHALREHIVDIVKSIRFVEHPVGDGLDDPTPVASEHFGVLELPESAGRLVSALVALDQDLVHVAGSHERSLRAGFSANGATDGTDQTPTPTQTTENPMSKHVLHLSDAISTPANGLRDLLAALRELSELREFVVERTNGIRGPGGVALKLDGSSAAGARDLHAVVEFGDEHRDFLAAAGALGADLKIVLDRHRNSLLESLSADVTSEGTDRASSVAG